MAKAVFNWEDPFMLDQQLADDERMVMDSARKFASDALMPRVIADYREESFDKSIMEAMGEMGLLGITVDEKYGGGGMNHVCYGLAAREIERVDSGYRSAMSVQSSLVMYPIETFGTDDQKERFLPALASGKMIGCFGLTEPDYGSDAGSLVTRAEKLMAVINSLARKCGSRMHLLLISPLFGQNLMVSSAASLLNVIKPVQVSIHR